jgi:hypothetical protein
MAYELFELELFELYPINLSQLANYRRAFFSSGAKDDRPDADLLSGTGNVPSRSAQSLEA